MSERLDNDTQWWLAEPPIETTDVPPEEEPELLEREYLDGTKVHPLFVNTRITEINGHLAFYEPPRIIDTPEHGKWSLAIRGARRWLKERDDYGDIRFTASGISFWVPHLFPFEDVDEGGLPIIKDRERCEMQVELQSLSDIQTDTKIAVSTEQGLFTANKSIEFHNPHGRDYFVRFQFLGRSLVSELVTWPESQWSSLRDYLTDPNTPENLDDYADILMGEQPLPAAYDAKNEPHDWQTREPTGFTGDAFGKIHVPVDDLRYGINASISFPCFQPRKNN